MSRKGIGMAAKFLAIFSHKRYIALAAISAVLFYYLFYYLIVSNNRGAFLLFIPIYLVYALVITSGILFAITVFSVAYALASKKSEVAGGLLSILLPSLGGIVATCACEFPILASVLVFFGINSFDAVGIVSIVGNYGSYIVLVMIALNLAVIYYYLGRLSFPVKRR